VLPDKIVYDAQTTSGGSGGPLFNNEGKVIGINFAMVREFGGSNFAIPVGYGKSLLNLKPLIVAEKDFVIVHGRFLGIGQPMN